MKLASLDGEYTNRYDINQIPCIVLIDEEREITYRFVGGGFETPDPDNTVPLSSMKPVVERLHEEGYTFLIFTASAELTLMKTLGIDILELSIIDLYVLYTQLTKTHKNFLNPKPSLDSALKDFNINVGYGDQEKADTRNLIILKKRGFTKEEMKRIVQYCEKDVKGLKPLFHRMVKVISNTVREPEETIIDYQIGHGVYLTSFYHADFHNQGFPVNEDRVNQIWENMFSVKKELAAKVNNTYTTGDDKTIYFLKSTKKKATGLIEETLHFKMDGFTDLIKRMGLYDAWPKTDSGKLKTDSDTFDDKLKSTPGLQLLYRTRKTMTDLSAKSDLRELMKDGFVKSKQTDFPFAKPFATRTSRTSPLPAKGFILNKTPWMRCALIQTPGADK